MKNMILVVFALSLSILIATANAAEPPKGAPSEADMKKMMELGMPGEKHKALDGMVGTWDYTVTYKMSPDAPEQTSTGISDNKWVLDGRFVQQNVGGTMDMNGEKKEFKGVGYIGHDNVKGEYISTWMDNMSTGLMTSNGIYDEASKSIKESGQFYCPIKNGEIKFESELKFIDATHYSHTMYDVSSGEKSKMMEITYTKK
jgi:hypothetical protein